MKTIKFSRSKNKWNNEEEALQDILQANSIDGQKLEAAHTDKQFVWKVVPETFPAAQFSENARFSLAKKEYKTEKKAVDHIIKNNDFVHEAQLKPCHTATHWQFNTK